MRPNPDDAGPDDPGPDDPGPEDPGSDDAGFDDAMSDDPMLARVVDVVSSITAEDAERTAPPTGLWDTIAARLPEADQPQADQPEAALAEHSQTHAEQTVAVDSPVVIDMEQRRRQRWRRVAGAAAVVVLAAGTIGVIATSSQDTTQEVVASVDLEPLTDAGTGTAELVTVDGVDELRITTEGLPPAPDGHHYEMWLIDAAVTDPRSVGQLPTDQDEIVVEVPDGVDPADHPIVDINVQVDGEVQHSGVDTSVLRGSLA